MVKKIVEYTLRVRIQDRDLLYAGIEPLRKVDGFRLESFTYSVSGLYCIRISFEKILQRSTTKIGLSE